MAFLDELLTGSLMEGARRPTTTGAELVRVTSGFAIPVTVQEVKTHGKITHNLEDKVIEGLIKSSTQLIENSIGIGFTEQSWKETFDRISRVIDLSMRQVLSIVSIKFVPNWDADSQEVVSSSNYVLSHNKVAARSVWPTHRGWKSFEVTYKVGFTLKGTGDEAVEVAAAQAAIPDDLKLALMELVLYLYENREGQGFEAAFVAMIERGVFPPMVDQFLKNYVEWGV